jgi:hypothetical protein
MLGRILLVAWIVAGGGAALFSLVPRRERRRAEPTLPSRPGMREFAHELETAQGSPLRREGAIRRFRALSRDLVSLRMGVDEETSISIVREGTWIDDDETKAFIEEDPFTAATLKKGGRIDPSFLERAERALVRLESYRAGTKESVDEDRGSSDANGEGRGRDTVQGRH